MAWVHTDPYSGLAASQVTSHAFSLREALAATFSWHTTAGTVSGCTLFVSNHSHDGQPGELSTADASWVAYAGYGTGTPAVIPIEPGIRYGHFRRTVSGSSIVVNVNMIS
jgi:hypothetical protein